MWRNLGIDAGMFSRRLMSVASEAFGHDHDTSETTLETAALRGASPREIGSPEALLRIAFEEVTAEGIKGSTTACIATIDASYGVMRTANVGDSGFMLIRGDPGKREVAPGRRTRSTSSVGRSSSATTPRRTTRATRC